MCDSDFTLDARLSLISIARLARARPSMQQNTHPEMVAFWVEWPSVVTSAEEHMTEDILEGSDTVLVIRVGPVVGHDSRPFPSMCFEPVSAPGGWNRSIEGSDPCAVVLTEEALDMYSRSRREMHYPHAGS